MLSRIDEKIVQDLKHRLAKVAGDRLQSVIVYGSRVWGEPDSESDLDVAVIIRDYDPQLAAVLQEAAYEVMWDNDFNPLISLKIFDSHGFTACLEKGFSYYRKVAQDGITL